MSSTVYVLSQFATSIAGYENGNKGYFFPQIIGTCVLGLGY